MKLKCLLICLMALLAVQLSAQADTYYVNTKNGKSLNLRSERNNAVIGNIPNGTMLETDDARSTENAAYVTYGGKSGFVKWGFLSKEPPAGMASGRPTPIPLPTAAPQTGLLPAGGEGDVTIQVYGAYIQYSGQNDKYSSISYNTPVKVKVTADLPRGKTLAYWVIDGVRYDFKSKLPDSFVLSNAQDSMIIEAVPKGGVSQTAYTKEAIQQMRTGLPLIVSATHYSRLCHVKADLKGAGGWIEEFDFTADYVNRATRRHETGGQVTVRVKATPPSGKKVTAWKFDDTELDFSTNVTEFVVHALNVSKHYQPVIGKSTSSGKTSTSTSNQKKTMYHISCRGCEFSGGGYSGARNGDVAEGTQVTFRSDYATGLISYWTINGSRKKTYQRVANSRIRLDFIGKNFSVKVSKDMNVVCYPDY